MRPFQWLYGQPYILLLLTALFWGGNAVAGKLAVGHVSPFLLTALRWAAAMAIVYLFALPHLKRDLPAIRRNIWFLALLGAIGFTVFNNLMYSSLIYTTAINVAIIQAAMPLIVFLLNFLLFGLRTTGLQLAGFALTLVGVATIASSGSLEVLARLAFNLGDLLMFVAIMTYGAYSVLLKQKPQMHWLSFISVLGTSALLASLPFVAHEALTGTLVWPDLQGWGVVLYTAIFPSILSQVFWMRGLELIGSNRGGVFINLVPVFGSALAITILGERFHLYHAIALVLVIGGVWLSQRRRKTAAA
ncbi:DMT family transporter [Salaquimonas pukyongi]|uniref:DMT family transporter n=1 Tax=Salaquimonas pukyongi TaxID=2712698 RepID=UPI00096BC0E8|nr:DMT family transporter [Salaquimonas pukyongi]